MNNLLGPGLVSGNEIITLRNGDEIFPAMLKAIRGAKHSINFETYVYFASINQAFGIGPLVSTIGPIVNC